MSLRRAYNGLMAVDPSFLRLSDRIQGSLLAGALGDAMGVPFEGMPGPLDLGDAAGREISDDTQLTLATCEAVIAAGDVSPERIAGKFAEWFRAGRITGVGAGTLKALRDLDAGAHWALSGARGERAAGCGAAMRIAPLAFLLDPANDVDRLLLRDISRITHHHEEAYVGALAMTAAVRFAALETDPLDTQLLPRVIEQLPDSCVRDRLLALRRLAPGPSIVEAAQQFGCTGYVADAVPLAILAAAGAAKRPLVESLQEVIRAGGDTDTIAAMTGQIVGARCGLAGIPGERIRRLRSAEAIMAIVTDFARQAARMLRH